MAGFHLIANSKSAPEWLRGGRNATHLWNGLRVHKHSCFPNATMAFQEKKRRYSKERDGNNKTHAYIDPTLKSRERGPGGCWLKDWCSGCGAQCLRPTPMPGPHHPGFYALMLGWGLSREVWIPPQGNLMAGGLRTHALVWRFSALVPWLGASASPGDLIKIWILGPPLDSLNQKLWDWGLSICAVPALQVSLTHSAGSSSLRRMRVFVSNLTQKLLWGPLTERCPAATVLWDGLQPGWWEYF